MPFLGDLERLLSDLYPYRVPLTAAGLVVVLLAGWWSVRRGWYATGRGWVSRHLVLAGAIAVVVLAVGIPTGNYLLSPLWERTTLDEASPLAVVSTAATAEPTASPATSVATSEATSQVEETPDAAATAVEVTSETSFSARVVAEGEVSGADDFHFGEGRALIIETAPGEYILRFEEFSVRNGPDLFVYLSSNSDVPSADAVKLGELKATDGAFNYEIPAGVDVGGLGYAMVWCDAFAVLFATAPLTS